MEQDLNSTLPLSLTHFLALSPSLSVLLRMQIAMIPLQFKQYREGRPGPVSRPLATHVLCLRFFYINRRI